MTRKRLFQTGFLLSLYLFILTPPQEVYHGWDLVIGLGAIALFAALHLLLERPTWQLYPSYGTVPLLFILFFYPEGWFILLLRLVGTLGLTLSVLATIIVPVPHLPALPPGGFKVGTITECWMQRELVSEDWASQDKKKWQQRKLWAKIWYPADSDDPRYLTSPHAPYLLLKGEEIIPGTKLEDLIEANPAKKILGDASWIKSHIVHYTKCHARYGAPLSPHLAQWPVVVYEHGQHSAPEKNTAFCERLASRGYVVFAIYNDDADKAMPGPWNRRQRNLQHMLRRIGAISALPELSVGIKPPARRLLPFMQSASTPTIVERLGLNMFVDRLDVSRGVGLFGHSLGGTTTMMACCRGAQSLFNRPEAELEPERSEGEGEDATFDVPDIVCGVALDAWMRPVREALDAPDRQVVKPLLVINSDEWQSKPGDLAKQAGLVQRRSDDAVVYMMTAKGTSHENFTDFAWLFATRLPGRPILLPRSWMKEADSTDMLLLGSSSPHEVWYSWTSVVESFFDKHLLLPPEMSVESYGSMLLFDPLFTIKIYSNMEHQEMQQQKGQQEDEEEEEEGQARRLNTAGAGTGGHHG